MARRVAINLTQRSLSSNRGRGNAKTRGRSSTSVVSFPENNIIKKENINAIVNENVNENVKEIINENEIVISKIPVNTVKVRTIDTISIENQVNLQIENKIPESNINNSNEIKQGLKRSRDDLHTEENETNNNISEILKIMGFDNFNTTKYKHVKGTDCFGINFKQKTEYRQYMNRDGGFNRALSPTRGDRKRIKISLKKE
ncbi:hypothetical protein C6P40_000481 [Pichia californica]|uniref:U4/U6.U5 small nuclear ribonucleoprotein 27kDa protein domain-containing protein n=1 Tax=Pichia californica TaxID=460514 RepID=A0A9P6WRI2_9ASCO|nr:hypothetical protein C6P42_001874 [[Candida] californica]KAG0690983.1 hypothetical protein C6P40_000481 [[Candida] californica]